MKVNWVFSNQEKEVLKNYSGPVVWVNKCERCGEEEAVYKGPLEVALFQSKRFIRLHKTCKEAAK